MLIATVSSSLRQHPSVPASVHTGSVPDRDVTPGPFLVQELLAGKEPVDQEV